MKFYYIASQPNGRVIESEIEAKNVAEVLAFLAKNGLKPVSVKPLPKSIRMGFFRARVTLTDQIFISKYLALMLKIGTGLFEAINILIADFQKTAVKEILMEIRANLERGNPFYMTFARYPRVFSQVYVNLIRAGEVSGNLEKVFEDLAVMLTKNKELKEQMRSSLVYPVILLVGSVFILTFLVVFALPKIANVFIEGGFEPPVFSRIVFSIGFFLRDIGAYLLAIVVGGLVAVVKFYQNSVVLRRFLFSVVNEIPIIRDVVRKVALQRFANILASLIKAGIPLTEALEITAQAVGNPELRDALMRISREGLARGLTIGEAFRKEPYFPQTVVNLVSVSERAGHIEDVLETLSEFYVKEIDSSLKTLVSFLEPMLLLFIGTIIGSIALAIIVPIYQLTTQF